MNFDVRFWCGWRNLLGLIFIVVGLASCRSNERTEPAGVTSPGPGLSNSATSGQVSGELQTLPAGYESGEMSWYTVKTNGGTTTASGEPLRDGVKTAAHRTLPFGTMVEVENTLNQRTTVVKITDRGPHVDGRIIDVSMATAQELGFAERGVAPCRIRVLR
jgi:rare lipoprotein A